MLPGKYCSLDRREKAFIIASIQTRIESEKKEQERIKAKSKRMS